MKISHKRHAVTSGTVDPFAARTNHEDYVPIRVSPAGRRLSQRFAEGARASKERQAVDVCHAITDRLSTFPSVARTNATNAIRDASRGDYTLALAMLEWHKRRTSTDNLRAHEAA